MERGKDFGDTEEQELTEIALLTLARTMQLVWEAHPPRVRFDAPRVEQLTSATAEPNGASSLIRRLADEASVSTRGGARVLPETN